MECNDAEYSSSGRGDVRVENSRTAGERDPSRPVVSRKRGLSTVFGRLGGPT